MVGTLEEREWVILIICLFLFILYIFSCTKMYKIYRKINTETVVVALASLDVTLTPSYLDRIHLLLRFHLSAHSLGLHSPLFPVLPHVDDRLSLLSSLPYHHLEIRSHQYVHAVSHLSLLRPSYGITISVIVALLIIVSAGYDGLVCGERNDSELCD